MNLEKLANRKFLLPATSWLFCFILGIIFYNQAIGSYFVADSLVGVRLVWKDVYTELTDSQFVFGYRPIGVAWFVFCNTIWGDFATGHHLMALALHASNGMFLFLITFRLYKNMVPAIIAAILFITFPIHVEAVQWLAATAGSVTSVFFFFLAAWIWLRPVNFPTKKQAYLSALFYLLALLTKEVSALLPLILILFDWRFKRLKQLESVKHYFLWLLSYWPFAVSLVIYIAGYYFSGSFNHSFSNTTEGYSSFVGLLQRLDQFAYDILLPVSGFIEWRVGNLNWIWLIVFIVLLHWNKRSRLAFIVALMMLFPGLFYYAERLTYLPMAFLSIGLAILFSNSFDFIHGIVKMNWIKLLLKSFMVTALVLLLVLNFRFVQRKLEPWKEAARLCKTIPEKVYQLVPIPLPGSQIILVDMTISPGIPVSLWALFKEVEQYYKNENVEIRQIYDGPDIENLINISSMPCKSERTRYFIKYFLESDSVGIITAKEAGVRCDL